MTAKLRLLIKTFGFLAVFLINISLAQAQQPDLTSVKVTRLLDKPIIGPDLHPSIGVNIQGPSLIKVPEWIENPLGKYYLYFADHKGLYIRLAYADELAGPWNIYAPGSLKIEHSYFAPVPPPVSYTHLTLPTTPYV